jgi:hypothetical protein
MDALASFNANSVAWAVSRWQAEVSQRPLVNVHRRTLDDTWRQVIRHFGGDPDKLIGPNHDTLLANHSGVPAGVECQPPEPAKPEPAPDGAATDDGWRKCNGCTRTDDLCRWHGCGNRTACEPAPETGIPASPRGVALPQNPEQKGGA